MQRTSTRSSQTTTTLLQTAHAIPASVRRLGKTPGYMLPLAGVMLLKRHSVLTKRVGRVDAEDACAGNGTGDGGYCEQTNCSGRKGDGIHC